MKLLFKITTDTPNESPNVGDTNFQQHYTGVNTSMSWAELQPGVRQATEKFMLPFIGQDFYDDLADKFEADETLSAELAKALELMQDAIASYTAYHLLPQRNGFMASAGVMQNTPADGSGQPINQWGWKAMRWSALEDGDTFMDRLLGHLEKQVKAENAEFDLWKNSDAYSVKTSAFFRRTEELDEYLNIKGSRRSFLSLIPFLRQVEEDVILPVLCTDQFDALTVLDLDADGKKLLAKVRKAVAYLGLHAALPHHRVVIDGDGFRIVSQSDTFDDRRNLTNNTHETAINALGERSERLGRQYLADLQTFLANNADTYTLWRDSDCNAQTALPGHTIVVSDDRIGGIGIF